MKWRDKKDFVPEKGIDILLVVNMFLTGFDAKTCNTLYVDKNLRYHGLIQAFSRTNRILGQVKSQGNVVCFRNLKEKVDDAIALFSNRDASDQILIEPYQVHVDQFNKAAMDLFQIAATPNAVDKLESEEDILAFVRTFRELMRIRNVLSTFAEFSAEDLVLDPQGFEDYKSKYLDIHDRVKANKDDDQKASIVDEVDFELELIRRDNINVAYILALLASMSSEDADDAEDAEAKQQVVLDLLGSEPRLRSKRELIEEFISSYLPKSKSEEETIETFWQFWKQKQTEAFETLCSEEDLDPDRFNGLLEAFQFSNKAPLTDEVLQAVRTQPGILTRKSVAERIIAKMVSFLERFQEGLGE
ncbi:MAG: hypothetical protein N4A70_08695 [Pelagimonas sp.]|nr:hypothetical protein [Pelagimonas sp.]